MNYAGFEPAHWTIQYWNDIISMLITDIEMMFRSESWIDVVSMSLFQCHFSVETTSFRHHFNVISTSKQCCFNVVVSMSLFQCHFNVETTSFRHHFNVISTSKQCCFNVVVSMSLFQCHFNVETTSFQYHFNIDTRSWNGLSFPSGHVTLKQHWNGVEMRLQVETTLK